MKIYSSTTTTTCTIHNLYIYTQRTYSSYADSCDEQGEKDSNGKLHGRWSCTDMNFMIIRFHDRFFLGKTI
jgi:hypothetical protein